MKTKNLIFVVALLLLAACSQGNKKECYNKQEKEQRQEQVAVPKEGEILEIQLSGSHDYKHEFKLSEIADYTTSTAY
ncbi:hypothetical protein FACS1894123_05880 [Bacteroidia bacterium]|nr:hypothetical protein FACS1894123_05880 [Bacteroidia bacterium]